MIVKERRVEIETLGPSRVRSPLPMASKAGQGHPTFVSDETWVRHQVEVIRGDSTDSGEELLFEKAGPRSHLYFDPKVSKAAVVTCGGLCPGLNDVIRSLYLELHFNYKVPEFLGIRHGYMGFSPNVAYPPIPLTRDLVSNIHKEGGTVLGSSRGKQDVGTIVDFLSREHVNMLFCVGGDGTLRGAHAIAEEVKRRGLSIAVVGIPKTIDNDVRYCTSTFGYVSAVDLARQVVHLAHIEAKGAPRGIGLVKLMGRDAGFIACGATLACQEVNFTLIPEVPFQLSGKSGLFAALERRMTERGHAVIVVSEGAGQHLFEETMTSRDASGNRRYHDIGPYLKARIVEYFQKRGQPVELKYIDPSYIVRSAPANTEDSVLCDQLARRAAHAAISGRTDLIVGGLNSSYVHIPIPMAVLEKRQVDPEGELWGSVLAVTGQPESLIEPPKDSNVHGH